jgi:hypothetical protein
MHFFEDSQLNKILKNQSHVNHEIVKLVFDAVNNCQKIAGNREKQIQILMVVINGIQDKIDNEKYAQKLLMVG